MLRRLARLAFVVLLASGYACTRVKPDAGARVDRNMITKEQLTKNHYSTVYDAVEALRANWLQTRGTDSFQSPSQVKVYLDNAMYGGVESMRNISATTISFIRWFDGVSASARWGLDHGAGVIFVSTRPVTTDPHHN
jgi:hypothetical protein